jgi:hypothetical protein
MAAGHLYAACLNAIVSIDSGSLEEDRVVVPIPSGRTLAPTLSVQGDELFWSWDDGSQIGISKVSSWDGGAAIDVLLAPHDYQYGVSVSPTMGFLNTYSGVLAVSWGGTVQGSRIGPQMAVYASDFDGQRLLWMGWMTAGILDPRSGTVSSFPFPNGVTTIGDIQAGPDALAYFTTVQVVWDGGLNISEYSLWAVDSL